MNRILIVLLVLLTISCKLNNKNSSAERVDYDIIQSISIEPRQFIKVLPNKLIENSGVIFYDNLFWTINDSGGRNKLYAYNFKGEIEKEIKIENAKNIDWEDLAQDKKHIYVGDFGNNHGNRRNQTIYKIEKKKIGKQPKQKVKAEKIRFNFENQTNFKSGSKTTSFDCEAIVEYNKSLYIFTKDWVHRTTTVYRIPRKKGEYSVQPIDTFNVNGLITGADISPDKKKLALIGYKDFNPFLWLFSNITKDNLWGNKQLRFEMDSIFYAQTEGVCFLGNDTILISCEASYAFRHQLFYIDLNSIEK